MSKVFIYIFNVKNFGKFLKTNESGNSTVKRNDYLLIISGRYCGSDAAGEFFNYDQNVFYIKEPFEGIGENSINGASVPNFFFLKYIFHH